MQKNNVPFYGMLQEKLMMQVLPCIFRNQKVAHCSYTFKMIWSDSWDFKFLIDISSFPNPQFFWQWKTSPPFVMIKWNQLALVKPETISSSSEYQIKIFDRYKFIALLTFLSEGSDSIVLVPMICPRNWLGLQIKICQFSSFFSYWSSQFSYENYFLKRRQHPADIYLSYSISFKLITQ